MDLDGLLDAIERAQHLADPSISNEDLFIETDEERQTTLRSTLAEAASEADDVQSEIQSISEDADFALGRVQAEVEDAQSTINRLTGWGW